MNRKLYALKWHRLLPLCLEVAQALACVSAAWESPVKSAPVEHPDSYEWRFTKIITG